MAASGAVSNANRETAFAGIPFLADLVLDRQAAGSGGAAPPRMFLVNVLDEVVDGGYDAAAVPRRGRYAIGIAASDWGRSPYSRFRLRNRDTHALRTAGPSIPGLRACPSNCRIAEHASSLRGDWLSADGVARNCATVPVVWTASGEE